MGLGTDVGIDFEELSSPILERPTTLPEMNSRPASRVMKSFSCDEVGELEIWNINIRFSDIYYDYIIEIGAFILFLLPFENILFDLFSFVHCKIL